MMPPMNRIDIKVFEYMKTQFRSDRHQLRQAARAYVEIQKNYKSWQSSITFPENTNDAELELVCLAFQAGMQYFESSFDFAIGLEEILHEKHANNLPTICILIRQSFECVLTTSWIFRSNIARELARTGFQLAARDMRNLLN